MPFLSTLSLILYLSKPVLACKEEVQNTYSVSFRGTAEKPFILLTSRVPDENDAVVSFEDPEGYLSAKLAFIAFVKASPEEKKSRLPILISQMERFSAFIKDQPRNTPHGPEKFAKIRAKDGVKEVLALLAKSEEPNFEQNLSKSFDKVMAFEQAVHQYPKLFGKVEKNSLVSGLTLVNFEGWTKEHGINFPSLSQKCKMTMASFTVEFVPSSGARREQGTGRPAD